MKKAKTTKRAFIMSLCTMVLCCSMLVGSTFAWFTDSATSGKNKIVAGNLDIGLEVKDSAGNFVDATKVADNSLFKVDLWEPGVVAYETFKAVNNGNLALKYSMYLSSSNATTIDNGKYSLADVIKVAVIDGELTADTTREGLIAAVKDKLTPITNSTQVTSGKLLPKGVTDDKGLADFTTDKVYTVVAYWEPTDVDNIYNLNNGKKADGDVTELSIDFNVTLSATQVPYEDDSINNEYDKDLMNTAIEAITDTINMGAKDANAAIAEAIKEQAGSTPVPEDLVYFDEDGLKENADGEQAITLNFKDGAQEYAGVTYTAVKELIGTAVNAQAGNIYSITIENLTPHVLNGSPDENIETWLQADLKTVVSGAGTLTEALEKAEGKGVAVTITSMDGKTEVYRMNFELGWTAA